MLDWINTHGLLFCIYMYGFSLVVSVMPETPPGLGFWGTWAMRVIRLAGADAGNLVKHLPAGQKIESLVASTKVDNQDGTETQTDVVSATIPKT